MGTSTRLQGLENEGLKALSDCTRLAGAYGIVEFTSLDRENQTRVFIRQSAQYMERSSERMPDLLGHAKKNLATIICMSLTA